MTNIMENEFQDSGAERGMLGRGHIYAGEHPCPRIAPHDSSDSLLTSSIDEYIKAQCAPCDNNIAKD